MLIKVTQANIDHAFERQSSPVYQAIEAAGIKLDWLDFKCISVEGKIIPLPEVAGNFLGQWVEDGENLSPIEFELPFEPAKTEVVTA